MAMSLELKETVFRNYLGTTNKLELGSELISLEIEGERERARERVRHCWSIVFAWNSERQQREIVYILVLAMRSKHCLCEQCWYTGPHNMRTNDKIP